MENTIKGNKGIVLNRMYVGDYLLDNIGHEAINLFKADNGGHYIYLNSRGNLAKEHKGNISTMLFVKYYAKGVVEVIGKAVGLEETDGATESLSRKLDKEDVELSTTQKKYIEMQEGGVCYNRASISDIFKGSGQQNIYITYKADAVYLVKKNRRVFIRFGDAINENVSNDESNKIILLDGYKQAKASLKQYIYPNSEYKDYENLIEIINDNDNWEDAPVGCLKDEIEQSENDSIFDKNVSLFDICKIQNDENAFSNALAYFMKKYPTLWSDFFKYGKCHKYNGRKLCKKENIDITLNTPWVVERERDTKIENVKLSSGRIDIFIYNNENIIVIENKIKSDINTVATDNDDKTQLDRYVNYVDWLVKNKCEKAPNCQFFILTPNYNIPQTSDEMKAKYKVITYRDLYDFLKESTEVEHDPNFKSFFDAIRRHTHDNVNGYLYYDMMEKFVRRINEVHKKLK